MANTKTQKKTIEKLKKFLAKNKLKDDIKNINK